MCERKGTYAGRYAPSFVPVMVCHNAVWVDTRLTVAGAQRDSQPFGDDGAEVGELFGLCDRERGGSVRAGFFELGTELLEYSWGGEEVECQSLDNSIQSAP